MVWILIVDFAQNICVTSSIHFVGIVYHCIPLCYLLAVLRLLCVL